MTTNNSKKLNHLVKDAKSGNLGRRDFLRRVVGAGFSSAVAYACLSDTEANAQNFTTRALGEEGQPQYASPPQTTLAVGEEGPPPTTGAVGEENTGPPVTTHAVGEEQQPKCRQPTTQRYGEESQTPPRATTFAVGEEQSPGQNNRRVTTLRVGEESTPTSRPSLNNGTSRSSAQRIRSTIRQQAPKVWNNFRRW